MAASSNFTSLQKKKSHPIGCRPIVVYDPFKKLNGSSKQWHRSSHFTFPFKDFKGRKWGEKKEGINMTSYP